MMVKSKKSITAKVIFGYVLVLALAVFAVVFLYNQLPYFTQAANKPQEGDQQLLTISNTLTNLYEAETLGRMAIQTGSKKQFNAYKKQISNIQLTIDSLLFEYPNQEQALKLDTIKLLLDKKTTTIKELSSLRQKELSKNYYKKAIDELSKADIIFEDYENDPRLADIDPYVKKVVVEYMEFLRSDNRTEQDSDSLVLNVKNTLAKLNAQNNKTRQLLLKKEATLLKSDQTITSKIRGLLSDVEKEVIIQSIKNTTQLENRMERAAQTLKYVGFGALFIILAFIIIIAKDNRKRQRYEQELETSKKYAESILKSKEQFMAAVTHDIRSPLTSIFGFTELLEQANPSPRQARYLEQLKSASNFTLQLVNDLLDLSKLESGNVLIEPRKFNAYHLLKQTFEEQTNSSNKPFVNYHLEIDSLNKLEVTSDPLRIKQILTNLISNAIKFTDKGSITLHGDIVSIKNQSHLKMAITDTGIGIAKDKQQLIFNEFTQAENETEQHYGGTGLGLTIAKKLTRLLKGSIKVDSIIDSGSTFTVTIPLHLRSKSKHHKIITDTDQIDMNVLKNKTILVIDDDQNQLSLLKELLGRNGAKVHLRNHAKRGLSFLKDHKVDLVITDIQMPNYDGFWLAHQLNKETISIPILALSGRTDLDLSIYLKAGFIAKIDKPFRTQSLLTAIANSLEGKKVTLLEEEVKTLNNIEFDLSEISEFVQGDRNALQKIISVFIENTEEQLALLVEHKSDTLKVQNIAHRMSPMFKQIHSSKIVLILKILEFETSNIDNSRINELIEELQFLIKPLFKKIALEVSQSHKA